MCNCKGLSTPINPLDAERCGLISYYNDVNNGRLRGSTGRLKGLKEVCGCCLYQCSECGQLWAAFLWAPYFFTAANKPPSQLKNSERNTNRDPSCNRGVVLAKVYTSVDTWVQEMRHRYEIFREPSLEAKRREYEARGYKSRQPWWDLIIFSKVIPKKGFFSNELTETIWMFVDVDGRIMYEKIVESKTGEYLEYVRY